MTQLLWKTVNIFFGLMVSKLIHQATVHGYSGWDQNFKATYGKTVWYFDRIFPACDDMFLRKLSQNIDNEDWVDVANLAMMLHYRKIQRNYLEKDLEIK